MQFTAEQYGRMKAVILEMDLHAGSPIMAIEGIIDSWLESMLEMLPNGATSENLSSSGPLFFFVAEELELELARGAGTFPDGMLDGEARSLLDSDAINRTALQLFIIMQRALAAMDGPSVETLAESFEELDIDAALIKLLSGA